MLLERRISFMLQSEDIGSKVRSLSLHDILKISELERYFIMTLAWVNWQCSQTSILLSLSNCKDLSFNTVTFLPF